MNKHLYIGLFSLFALLNSVVSVYAAEIPAYMKENLNSPRDNMCPIICNIMFPNGSVVDGVGAQALGKRQNEQKRRLVAKLYAEGLTTRTNMVKKVEEAKKEALEGEYKAPMEDAKEILDSMQPYLISIIEHLNSIASLEASIAALDGTISITDDPGKSGVCYLEKRCKCSDIIEGLSKKDICSEEEDKDE